MIFQKYPEEYIRNVKDYLEYCKVDMNRVLAEIGKMNADIERLTNEVRKTNSKL